LILTKMIIGRNGYCNAFFLTRGQGRTGHSDSAVISTRLFFENARLFFKNAWHFKDIFRAFEAFLKISILFEDIFREIESFSSKAFSKHIQRSGDF
jgi:hypothetical protein